MAAALPVVRETDRRQLQSGKHLRPVPLVAGTVLFAVFFALDETDNTISIVFRSPWDHSTRGELYFWLASSFVLVSAAVLLGLGVAPRLAPLLGRLRDWVAALDSRQRVIGALALLLIAGGVAGLGNSFVLGGLPFTDDEYAAQFGGQILAQGHTMVPVPSPREVFPDLFLYEREGRWTTILWLGVQLAWAVSELTHSGSLVFFLLSALAVLGVTVTMARCLGTQWGVVGAALFLASPMAATLSITTHAHVLSRGFLACGLALVLWNPRLTAKQGLLAGTAFGLALLTRPITIAALLLPLALLGFVALRSHPQLRRAVALGMLGIAVILVVALLHNVSTTGSLVPPRLAPNDVVHPYADFLSPPWSPDRFWNRFGANASYNLLTLAIWFLGPLGCILVAVGVGRDRVTRALGAGVALSLALCLLHDDRGIHCVGPLHYADVSVPLAILATLGAHRVRVWLQVQGIDWRPFAAVLASYLLFAMGTFTAWNAVSLRNQAFIQIGMYGLVEHLPGQPAILLVPTYGESWSSVPAFAQQGSWVFSWRRARPDLSDEVLVLYDRAEAIPELRQRFPERSMFRLVVSPEGLSVTPVDDEEHR